MAEDTFQMADDVALAPLMNCMDPCGNQVTGLHRAGVRDSEGMPR